MTDNPQNQQIRLELIVDNVQKTADSLAQIRKYAENLKNEYKRLGAEAPSQLQAINAAFKDMAKAENIRPVLNNIRRLKEEIRQLREYAKAGGERPQFISAQEEGQAIQSGVGIQGLVSSRQDEIAKLRNNLAMVREEYGLLSKGAQIASSETTAVWSASAKAQANAQRELTRQQSEEQRNRVEGERQAIAQEAAARKEYIEAQRNGYSVMSEAAQKYGQQIESIRVQIQNMANAGGMTFEQAAQKYGQSLAKIQAQIGQLAQQMGVSWRAAAQTVTSSAEQMGAGVSPFAEKINAIRTQISQLGQAGGVGFSQVAQQITNSNGQMNTFQTAVNGVAKSVQSLGSIAQAVFGGIFGITVVGVLRNVIQLLTQASEQGLAFAKAFFQLQVGVRVLRRSGMDITFADITANLERLREQYRIFTSKELVAGAAAFANLVRDLGLTKQQFFDLTDAVAKLAIVNSRSMEEVQRTVALALSSGYTEGLQRLGVSINRVTIAARAAAMGWTQGYTALTEYQRGQATLSLILEKTAKYQDDLNKYLETYPGIIDSSDAAVKQYSDTLGTQLLPLLVAWSKIKIAFINDDAVRGFGIWIAKVGVLLDEFMNRLNLNAEYAPRLWNSIFGIETIREVWSEYKNKEREIFENSEKLFGRISEAAKEGKMVEWDDLLPSDNPVEPFVGEVLEGTDDIEEATGDMAEKIIDIYLDLKDRLAALARDYANDIAEINRQLQFDISEVDFEKQEKIDDAISDYNDKRDKINRDYLQALSDAEYDYQKDLEQSQASYRERSIQEEIRYQEQLLGLRTSYYNDLDDALRSRDALQIIRVTRRFRQEREAAKRQHEQTVGENRRNYDREISEIAEVWRRKKEILARENADRLADLQLTLEKEKQEEEDAANERIEELRRRASFEMEERRIKWQEQNEEEGIRADERANRLIDEWVREGELTREGAEAVAAELAKVFGPGGEVERIRDYMLGLVASIGAALSAISNINFGGSISFPDPSKFGRPITTDTPSISAPDPSKFTLPNDTRMPTVVTPNMDGTAPIPQPVKLLVDISPNLMVELVENTTSEMVDAIIETQRRIR